jgi:hypothetical protein
MTGWFGGAEPADRYRLHHSSTLPAGIVLKFSRGKIALARRYCCNAERHHVL